MPSAFRTTTPFGRRSPAAPPRRRQLRCERGPAAARRAGAKQPGPAALPAARPVTPAASRSLWGPLRSAGRSPGRGLARRPVRSEPRKLRFSSSVSKQTPKPRGFQEGFFKGGGELETQHFLPSLGTARAEPAFPPAFSSGEGCPARLLPKAARNPPVLPVEITGRAPHSLPDLSNSTRAAKVISPIFSTLLKSQSSVGPLPQPECFGADGPMLGGRGGKPLLARYAADEVRICHLQREPSYRCQQDVMSLRESCRSYGKEVTASTRPFCEDPFQYPPPARSTPPQDQDVEELLL